MKVKYEEIEERSQTTEMETRYKLTQQDMVHSFTEEIKIGLIEKLNLIDEQY